MSIRIAIVEDDIDYRNSLSTALQAAGYDIRAGYSESSKACRDMSNVSPDVVIVDIGLPDGSGLDCISGLKEVNPDYIFVVLTVRVDDDTIFRAIQLGASGYISKTDSYEKIVDALKDIMNGHAFLSTPVARRVLDHIRKHPVVPDKNMSLTEREYDIVRYLAKGLSYKEIAALLFLSPDTVRRHIHNIYKKLRVRNRTEALMVLSGDTMR